MPQRFKEFHQWLTREVRRYVRDREAAEQVVEQACYRAWFSPGPEPFEDRALRIARKLAAQHRIRQALDRLPSLLREVYLLHVAAALSPHRIAWIKQLPVAEVEALIRQARSDLRSLLAE